MKGWGFFLLLLGSVIAAGPLASALLAESIANANGCQINEGGVYPCEIGGKDRGELLGAMFVAGWFMIYTMPIGAIIISVGFILFVIGLFRKPKAQE